MIGNERTDALTKEGISLNVTKSQLPLPKSYINFFLNQKFYPAGNVTGIIQKIESIHITEFQRSLIIFIT